MEIEIIQKSLDLENFDHIELAKLAGFNEKEIEMVRLFWEPAFNKGWIYLSSDIIHDYFGYKKTTSSATNFYSKMKEFYKIDIEYKEVSKDHKLVKIYEKLYLQKNVGKEFRGGALKKYYIITGTAFKKMGMKANTKKGDETCDYFIKVEELCSLMTKYTIEKLKLESREAIEIKNQALIKQTEKLHISQSKNLQLTTRIKDIEVMKINGFIYIMTTNQYSQNNQYRLGKTVKLNNRMSQYQVGRATNDEMYYVYIFETEDYDLLELLIRRLLIKFRDVVSKDYYVLSWSLLYKYVDYICQTFHNGLIKELNDVILNNIDFFQRKKHEQIIIPKPLNFTNDEMLKIEKLEEPVEEEEEEESEIKEPIEQKSEIKEPIEEQKSKIKEPIEQKYEIKEPIEQKSEIKDVTKFYFQSESYSYTNISQKNINCTENIISNIFIDWFHKTYEFVNDKKKYITMKNIYFKFKESCMYLNLLPIIKKYITKYKLHNELMQNKILYDNFYKNKRYIYPNGIKTSVKGSFTCFQEILTLEK